MEDRGVSRFAQILIAIVVAVAAVTAAVVAYRAYQERYTASVRDDGTAVAQVVAATLYRSADLRVSRLRGDVQGVAVDTRGFGMLRSQRITKAPFEVDYFVDLSDMGADAFRYDAERRTLLVHASGLRIERPDIDESRMTLDRTDGVFVTRDAMRVLQQRTSASAMNAAAEQARKPEYLAQAKKNARRALAEVFAGPLRAAGLDATVEVRFVDDPRRSTDRWDTSRSLQEVLGNVS